MNSIRLDRLNDLFRLLSSDKAVYVPQQCGSEGDAEFELWTEGDTYSMALNTTRSAKDFFFPQMEAIAKFRTNGKKVQVIDDRSETRDFVVFGARACDVASFDNVLDKVFLADPVDTFYQNRREHATIVAMACSKPASTCFCTLYAIDPTRPAGDVSAWTVDGMVYFQANNDKGKAFLESVSSLLEECDDSVVSTEQERVAQVLEKLPFGKLDLSPFSKGLKEVFSDPKWADLSQTCLGCGTCTFVCPTCQCFDIRDFKNGEQVQRYRCWDSCMFSEFTKMAAANPRLSQTERFRQRFMHKLVYFPENNNGTYSCVGCGRCLQRCPAHKHIVNVIKAFGEEN